MKLIGDREIMSGLELSICTWDEMDLDEVSKFVYRNRIGIYKNAEDFEGVSNYLSSIQERYPADSIFMVRRKESLCGWGVLDRESESVAELGRWQPIIEKTEYDSEIANLLLQGILDYAKKNGVTRVEGLFNDVNSDNLHEYERTAKWFNSKGIMKLEDNAYLTIQLSDLDLEPRPVGLDAVWRTFLKDADEEALYNCYYATFSSGDDRDFLDSTDTQRREKLDKSIHSKILNPNLSFIWKDGKRIFGFAVVHSRGEEQHIDRFGILQEYRGRGIAKSLLINTLQEAKNLGYSMVSIGVDTSNSSAFNLYKNIGFQVDSQMIIHAWKEE